MKRLIFLILIAYLPALPVMAQHALVGTWEMISLKGIDANGEPFSFDTTSVRETKIITPTHYMLIAWDVDGDSLIFNRTMAGEVRLENNKYIEIPTQASVQIFENVKVNFTWKLEENIFTQSGTIVRPDGKQVVLEALVFKRVTRIKPQSKNPAIGSWKLVSSDDATRDQKIQSTVDPSDSQLLIVTPTHWMRMDQKDNKFAGVQYGTYTLSGNKVLSTIGFSTYPLQKRQHKFTQQVSGTKLRMTYEAETPDGKPATFNDVFQKQ